MMFTQDFWNFVEDHKDADVRQLALKAKHYPTIEVSLAIQQIKGRQIIKEKAPLWNEYRNLRYPPHLSMEQASSEVTAKYKADLCKGDSFVDLTGGLGIDFYFMSQRFKQAIYVEQNVELAEIATHNLRVLPQVCQVEVKNQDSVSYLHAMSAVDTIYIDPARRDTVGRKTVLISDCTPNLEEIDGLLSEKSKQTIIKLSPMLDISLAMKSLTNITAVYVLSVKNDCKELVLVKDNTIQDEKPEVVVHCVDFMKDSHSIFSFLLKDEINIKYTSDVLRYLYEPNSSIMKAGGYNYLQKEFAVEKLHPNSHLYTSDVLFTDFPGRVFEVEKVLTLNKKEVKEYIGGLAQANVTVRNFPLSVNELRKKLKLKEGGELYLFATTLMDNKKVLIKTRKMGS